MAINTVTGNTLLQSGFFAPCRIASTGTNLPLSGLAALDGVTPIAGDRILVKDQTDQTTNGIYAAATGTWVRTTDAASNAHFFLGMAVIVAQGTVNAAQCFLCTATDDPVVIGTSLLTFASLTSLQSTTFVNPTIVGTLTATGGGTLGGVYGGNFTLGGNITINGTLAVAGAVSLSSTLSVAGKASFTSTDSMAVAKGTTGQRNGSPTSGDIRYNSTLNGLEYWNGTAWIIVGQAPTVQSFTSGSAQTYTPATGVVRIRVRMCGGGGGGGGATANAGTVGNDSSFGSWTAKGGTQGGAANAAGGNGGTGGTDGTGTKVVRLNGGKGQAGASTSASNSAGGAGGANPFGGAGAGTVGAAGSVGGVNTGAGGAGGGGTTAVGAGGGAGEYVEFWVTNPSATTYTVGAAANGGPAGGNAGGNGAAGIIIVEEFYS